MGAVRGEFSWRPALLEPEYCFDAVLKYATGRTAEDELIGISDFELKKKARQHLLALGWRIDIRRDPIQRYRFQSPEGKLCYSLYEACCDSVKINLRLNPEMTASHADVFQDSTDVPEVDQIFGKKKKNERMAGFSVSDEEVKEDMDVRSGHCWRPALLEPEYCFDAVSRCALGRKAEDALIGIDDVELKKKARQHLLALGWRIDFKRDPNVRYRFESPDGKCYYSLHKVCSDLVKTSRRSSPGMTTPHADVCRDSTDALEVEDQMFRTKKNVCTTGFSVGNEEVSMQGECSADAVRRYHDFTESEWRPDNQQSPGTDVLEVENQMYRKKSKNVHMAGFSVTDEEVRENMDVQGECSAVAVRKYLDFMQSEWKTENRLLSRADVRLLRKNVKNNLLQRGWSIWMKQKKLKEELCYTSPSGKNCNSLADACREYLKSSTTNPPECKDSNFKYNVTSDYRNETSSRAKKKKCKLPVISKESTARTSRSKKRKVSRTSSSSTTESCTSDESYSTITRFKRSQFSVGRSVGSQSVSSRVLRSSAKHVFASTSNEESVKTVLSWLIGNKVVVPGQKVKYVSKDDGICKKEGQVYHEGIKCMCCSEVFSIAKFEVHAGERTGCPSANIFFDDGSSLINCQKQIMDACLIKYSSPHVPLKGDYSLYEIDDICSVCHDGGDLIICDYCPSAFHAYCVGLKDVPEGKWSCPFCKCGICGLSEYNCNEEQFEAATMLCCDQCRKEYHVGCLRENRLQPLNCCPTGSWLCSKKCEQIFSYLHGLIGKLNATSAKNLSWAVLRMSTEDLCATKDFDRDSMAKRHSKLCVALDILHDCFEPVVEPRTGHDLVADILFNTWSELKRLKFSGFYTMVLEEEDALISVATFRVHNEKVAEMPLVATRAKHRKQGMCRLLVDELERLLANLGVERLLLPAVPQLVETWTTCLGFVPMCSSDLTELSNCTLLSFHGTIMCQKFLKTKDALKEHQVSVASSMAVEEIGEEKKRKYNLLAGSCGKMFSTTTPFCHRQAFQSYLTEGL